MENILYASVDIDKSRSATECNEGIKEQGMQFAICTVTLLCLIWPFCVTAGDRGGPMAQGIAGGPCGYEKINGRAIITAVKAAARDDYNCKDGVEIVFTFVPDDPSAKDKYLFPGHPDSGRRFVVGAGLNPPRKWAQSAGLVPGSTHRCIRQEMIRGACTPVVFIFPELDLAGWEKGCF
jgi:hypothetical protein